MWRALTTATRYFTLKAFNTDTGEGRSHERYRLAAWNTLANTISSAMGMLSLFVTIPLVLPYLGPERFGIWMSIASLAAIFSFMDLGIGNGLINLVARARINKSKPYRLNEIVFRGLCLLAFLGAVIGLAATGFLYIFPIENIIKVDSPTLISETHQTALTFAIIFSLSIPLFGLQRIFFGLQKSWLVHVSKIIGYIVSLILIWKLVQQQASIPALLFATYGVQTLFSLFLLPFLLYELRINQPFLKEKYKISTRQDIKALLGVGSIFFFLQIGGIVGWGSDALIAASMIGASAVAPLVIAQRLFQLVTVPLAIINGPLWAAYADANARNDILFIRKTLYRSLKFTLVFATIASLIIFEISNWLMSVWLGTENNLPTGLLLAFAIWAVIDALGNCFAMYLNGRNIVKAQLVVVILFCAVAIPLKFIFLTKFGIAGIVMATIIAYIFCVVLPYATFLKKYVLAGIGMHFFIDKLI